LSAPATADPALQIAYIGLGSNIEPEKNLPLAAAALAAQTHLLALSSAWKSPAIGTHGPDFYNAAAKIHTPQSDPDALKLALLRPIEASLGRIRTADKFAPRTIDLDILVFDDQILDPDIWKYAYLALPLAEIAPNIISLAETAQALRAGQQIERQDLVWGVSLTPESK
jgi:2-amino-4-hydroxy-6-hydroxymethyldihydropteridine diphosphokinase